MIYSTCFLTKETHAPASEIAPQYHARLFVDRVTLADMKDEVFGFQWMCILQDELSALSEVAGANRKRN